VYNIVVYTVYSTVGYIITTISVGEKVRLVFDALTIGTHPFTRQNVQQLYKEAQTVIEEEKRAIALGKK